jgi:aminoglycoside phosphotransferase
MEAGKGVDGPEQALELERLRGIVLESFPDLRAARFRLLPPGWHSVAVDADDRLVFKFPRNAEAQAALVREVGLLRVVAGALTMRVPSLTLHGPPCFSCHEKIPGEPLLAPEYHGLDDPARQRLAEAMARLHAELHGLDRARMTEAGATAIAPWSGPEAILRRAWGILPERERRYAEATLTEWADLEPDPYGSVFGYFDGHGWNMAFDHRRGRLNGVFDFADAGFGDLHQEFVYASFVSRDLARRIVDAYEDLTGRRLDRARIDLLTGVLRLNEVAESADDPEHRGQMLANLAAWAAGS